MTDYIYKNGPIAPFSQPSNSDPCCNGQFLTNNVQFVTITAANPMVDYHIIFGPRVNTVMLAAFDVPQGAAAAVSPSVILSLSPQGISPATITTTVKLPVSGSFIPISGLQFTSAGDKHCVGTFGSGLNTIQVSFKHPVQDVFISAWPIDLATGAAIAGGNITLMIIGSCDVQPTEQCCL